MNNLKEIRELYGATQEQVATAVGVNRVTVASWESGKTQVSSSNQEKLSLYYGIGPNFFYETELDEIARGMIQSAAAREREIVKKSEGSRNKETELHQLFSELDFSVVIQRYMYATKLLLATADDGDLDKLKAALEVNRKMGARLEALIKVREVEEEDGSPSLFDLMNSIGE